MPHRDVITWTSLISSYAKDGLYVKALAFFSEMRRLEVEPNEMTFSIVMTFCSKLCRVDIGMSLQCLVLKMGFFKQVFIASGLITMYSRCGYMVESRQVFDEIVEKDVVTWNSMMASYSQKDANEEALGLFSQMVNNNRNDWKLIVNCFTIATIFKACASKRCAKIGKLVHGYAIKFGFDLDIFVATSIIDMYSKCDSIDVARRVFDRMKKRDLVAWNSMITGYTQIYFGEEAIELFQELQIEGFAPNETTFSCIFKASAMIPDSSLDRCFHSIALKYGCLSDVFVGTALIDMYSKYYALEDAERAFEDMEMRNLVSFNALITGYSLSGRYERALILYADLLFRILRPDSFTFAGLLSSCSVHGKLLEGVQVHAHSIKFGLDSNLIVGNALVNLYAKCKLMERASEAFNSTTAPNAVSWAGIISGFTQNGKGKMALYYFCKMNKSSEKPEEFSITSVLKALGSLAAVEYGRHVHAYVMKMGLESSVFVGSALLDMYSKCGIVEDSVEIFRKMLTKNVVSWNSMIMGYALNGLSNESLLLFQEMSNSNVLPTCITFTGVLLACSNAGLVEEGQKYYNSMVFDYKLPPSVEHCTCMVDLLGRAGYIDDAETFILNSPFKSEPGLWRSLLNACGLYRNIYVGTRAAEKCLEFEPHESATYVILSSIYASKQLWDEVRTIRSLMRERGVEKEPGFSSVEVRDDMY
ncbi:hypothetical protein GIB67_037814 [Kingdonia uniflora]|uniref:Pentatricopeptide repeat-containing protein n=1 Tax=Kingdonia uniflora TaxID=39325 RepID=A0A7J7NB13_9MAGN|nr:hypothetical protein GIB67_017374 [Kingdonia uniflora]KAF6164048.1 hypothetical protein GIB67_037814 [Kingdonia uniflora]